MKHWKLVVLVGISLLFSTSAFAAKKSACVECHEKVTPGVVQQHLEGKMGKTGHRLFGLPRFGAQVDG